MLRLGAIWSFLAPCAIVACVISPPGATVVNVDESRHEDPDIYRVDSRAFPVYSVRGALQPPTWRFDTGKSSADPMPTIDSPDRWVVTHRVGGVVFIHSEAYQQRKCFQDYREHLEHEYGTPPVTVGRGLCRSPNLYYVAISPDGRIAGGWQVLANPELVMLRSERKRVMIPDQRFDSDWGDAQIFFARNN